MTGILQKSKGEEIAENIKMEEDEDLLGDLLNEEEVEELIRNQN